MKKIEAIIRATKFEDVKDALTEADIEWFSYYDVRGVGTAPTPRQRAFRSPFGNLRAQTLFVLLGL